MKHVRLPTISVVIATFNSSRTIELCLRSIRTQEYPQDNIEIILADGGSKDETREIARSYNVRWVNVDSNKQNAEYNKSIGISHAKNEILAMIDHDNVLPHKRWVIGMIRPLVEQKHVTGVETLRYHYDPQTSLIDRYFALFGAGDPLVWYLGKADRLSYIFDRYSLSGSAVDYGDYYLVQFTVENMPTIGANGFLVRRKVLMKYAQMTPGLYFDMDVNIDLIRKGYSTYAFVKDTIIHLTGYGSVGYFLKRRMLFISQYHRGIDKLGKKIRRYGILSNKGIIQLGISIVICVTLIIPLIDSFRGYRKIHDNAWFLHPLLCFSFVIIYSWAIIKGQVVRYAKNFLGK